MDQCSKEITPDVQVYAVHHKQVQQPAIRVVEQSFTTTLSIS